MVLHSTRRSRQQDSGWSYLVCACATFLQIVNMGLVASFGVLFPVIIKRFSSSRQETAWIGSLSTGLVFFAGPVASRMAERFTCRFVSTIGTIIVAAGLTLTSFFNIFYLYYFTYSLMVGFGGCCIRTACFLIVAKYFDRLKPFATGILMAGAGMGLFVFSPLTQTLLDNFGLENTFRALAGIVLVSGFLSLAYDHDVEETQGPQESATLELEDEESEKIGRKEFLDCSVWRVPTFTIYSLAFMLNCAGNYVPFVHLVKYAEEQGIPSDRSSQLLMLCGIASCIARILAGYVCNLNFINRGYVFQVGNFCTSATVVLFTVVHGYQLFALLSVFFGLSQGTVTTASNIIFLTCMDKKRRASAFGLANFLISVAIVTSPPFAGFLADNLGSYVPSFYCAAAVLVVSSVLPFLLFCIENPKNKRFYLSIQ